MIGGIDEGNAQFSNGKAYFCGEPWTGVINFWHKKESGATEIKCKRQTSYINGLKDGREMEYTIHGQTVFVCNYKEGKLDGTYLKYRPDGRVSETVEYVDGVRQDDTMQHYDFMGKALKK